MRFVGGIAVIGCSVTLLLLIIPCRNDREWAVLLTAVILLISYWSLGRRLEILPLTEIVGFY
jgi:hypothetical protein